ncbi:hypothetical protein ABZ614_43510 [Streptomyces sp. NPDC013178]
MNGPPGRPADDVGGKASGGPFVKKGTQVGMSTRISATVVDKAGDRK